MPKELHLFPEEFALRQLELQTGLLDGVQNKGQVMQMFVQGL